MEICASKYKSLPPFSLFFTMEKPGRHTLWVRLAGRSSLPLATIRLPVRFSDVSFNVPKWDAGKSSKSFAWLTVAADGNGFSGLAAKKQRNSFIVGESYFSWPEPVLQAGQSGLAIILETVKAPVPKRRLKDSENVLLVDDSSIKAALFLISLVNLDVSSCGTEVPDAERQLSIEKVRALIGGYAISYIQAVAHFLGFGDPATAQQKPVAADTKGEEAGKAKKKGVKLPKPSKKEIKKHQVTQASTWPHAPQSSL